MKSATFPCPTRCRLGQHNAEIWDDDGRYWGRGWVDCDVCGGSGRVDDLEAAEVRWAGVTAEEVTT